MVYGSNAHEMHKTKNTNNSMIFMRAQTSIPHRNVHIYLYETRLVASGFVECFETELLRDSDKQLKKKIAVFEPTGLSKYAVKCVPIDVIIFCCSGSAYAGGGFPEKSVLPQIPHIRTAGNAGAGDVSRPVVLSVYSEPLFHSLVEYK